MKKVKLKVGDLVSVISGKDKGKQGKITKIIRNEDKVVVEGVNRIKKNIKPRYGQAGQVVELDAPVHISNVMLFDSQIGKRTRIGYKVTGEESKRVRISKKTNNEI